jgi:hypothetical protein
MCCRILGSLPLLKNLALVNIAPAPEEEPSSTPCSLDLCPMLHAVQSIYVSSYVSSDCACWDVLARRSQIPATTRLSANYGAKAISFRGTPPTIAHFAAKHWRSGWLPAMLGSMPSSHLDRGIIVAADDSDIDAYLAAAASLSPSQQLACKHALWLGTRVTPAGFARLLSCPQQPPVRLEIDSAAQEQLDPYILEWDGCMHLGTQHFRALAGLPSPQLVSLLLADCEQLTNHDVAMLAAACRALTDLQLLRASKLSDLALHSLAAGCRLLERVQLSHASVTADGVVVALTTLWQLKSLQVGGVPLASLEQLPGLVAQQLAAGGYLPWAVEGPSSDGPSITWERQGGC